MPLLEKPMGRGLNMWHPRMGLRAKVVILSMFLLCLPWLGYEYVWEMEKYLRNGQERTLEGTTQALATALHERPKLFHSQASFLTQVEKGRDLYAYPLSGPIQLDGKLHDWDTYRHRFIEYGQEHEVYKVDDGRPLSLSFTHMVGKFNGYLYGFFDVTDPSPVYRGANSLSIERSDRLMIATLTSAGDFKRYLITPIEDGWISAYELPADPLLTTPVTPQPQIQGQWRKSEKGYVIELRIPLDMLGSKLGFAIYDVNDRRTGALEAIVGTSATDDQLKLGTVLVPSPEIEEIIKGMRHNTARIWVVDKHGRVLAKSGDIRSTSSVWTRDSELDQDSSLWGDFSRKYLRPLYYRILTQPPRDFIDSLQDSTELSGSHIEQALNGKLGSTWRLTPDNKAVVLAAASPIWIDDKVMGVVVAEETTHGIRTLRNQALEKLFNIILIVMGVGTLSLFLFASNISRRVRRLRDEAERAIDSQGRIKEQLTPSPIKDEIGDLSRSFASIVSRLGQYTHYLENMSSRLSHELRTPVAVVRSSLEHLELQGLDDHSAKYVARAREGVSRLSLILNNMSEATRLEQSLEHAEPALFPLKEVVSGCMQGYQMTFPQQAFNVTLPDAPLPVYGVPEYIAQLLDKLIANACEFSEPGAEIAVSLDISGKQAVLEVSNQGPALPENMAEQIFDSMVSVRPPQGGEKPHLGLGLYIARLIAQYHQGQIKASNRQDGKGVRVELRLPLAKEA